MSIPASVSDFGAGRQEATSHIDGGDNTTWRDARSYRVGHRGSETGVGTSRHGTEHRR